MWIKMDVTGLECDTWMAMTCYSYRKHIEFRIG